ncbi:MAG: WD40 repeat domain-containing protein, partial [Actinomycetota bacterium]
QRDNARAAADVADSRQLAARSLAEPDLAVSLLLAREAVALDDSAQTRNALVTALQRDPAAIAMMHTYGSTPGDLTQWLQLSPDGHVIAAGGARTTVDFFDAATYQPLDGVDVGAETTTGDFSADGGTLAVATVDPQIVAIDVNTRTIRKSTTSSREIDALLFAPQGGPLFTAESIHGKGFLVPRDPVTLDPISAPVQSESGPITAMDSSTDGGSLVTTGLLPPDRPGLKAYTDLWHTQGLEHAGGPFPWGGNAVALSADGQTAAIAAAEFDSTYQDKFKGRLVLLDLETGQPQISPMSRRRALGAPLGLTGVTFSIDGRSVISTGDDHRMLVWDVASLTIEAFEDPAGENLFALELSPDGATLFTVDADGNIVVWDLNGDQRLGRSFVAGSGAMWNTGYPWFAISPDGTTLAINQITNIRRGSVRFVDASTMEGIAVTPDTTYGNGFTGFPEGLAFSPDGNTLAISAGGYVQLWDAHTGSPSSPPFRAPGSDLIDFWVAAFSPDGSVLATAGGKVVFLWDVATGQLIGQLKPEDRVWAVTYSPDGTRLVVSAGHNGGDQIVWNIEEGRVERTIHADDSGLFWADISNDGATLVTGGQSSGVRLWDLATGDQMGSAFTIGAVNTVDLSPDGQTLVAAGRGQVIMWDVATGSILGRSWFTGAGSGLWLAAAFTPDGRRLFINSASGDAWVWDLDPASWESRACQIAGRSLTEAEWQVNLPDRPYDPACVS